MDAARWIQLQSLFHEVLSQPAEERRDFLKHRCGDDEQLLSDVLALLDADAHGNALLERDPARLADAVLDGPVPPLQNAGDYRIKSVLGRGGMGVVYLAEDEALNRQVAVKVLGDATLSPHRRERFAREVRVLAQFTHPAIARLYDADTLPDGTPYFVMEYIEGVPITTYCKQHRLSISERLRLVRSVCEAVQCAHQQAIIHRDLKPTNILVTEEGDVRLLDFGIAKELLNDDASASVTQTGLRLMTPAYAAPEQLRGEPVGVYTDVYALGVILYELLTGSLPFDFSGLAPAERDALILEKEPAKPSTRKQQHVSDGDDGIAKTGRHSWADLDVLCRTAMHKDPQRRYASVESLLRDIDHYLDGEPLEARPDSFGYRLSKFVQHNAHTIAASTIIMSVILIMTVFYAVQLTAARDAALEEAARTQRIQSFVLNLFEGGDAVVGPADSLRVVTLLDRGVMEARMLDSDPIIQAELLHTLGRIFRRVGSLDQADSLLQAAHAQRLAYYGDDHPEVVDSEISLGLLRLDQARLEEAEEFIRSSLEKSREQYPAHHPSGVAAANALGMLLQAQAAYDDAIVVLEEAVRVQQDHRTAEVHLAESMRLLANAQFYAGDYTASDSLNRLLLGLNRDLYGNNHPRVADVLINLGAIHFQRASYDVAEDYYRRALDIMEGYYGPDHYRTAGNLSMLARALLFQERYDESIPLNRRAVEILERTHGPMHPRVANNLNDLGSAALRQGQFADAETYFLRMAEIYRDAFGERHNLLGVALSNVASVYLEQGQYERAKPLFQDVIALFEEVLSPEHMSTGIARIKLGRVLTRTHRYKAAEEELLAGYDILIDQTSPSVSWLRAARTDLVTVYEAVGDTVQAAHFRAEQEQFTEMP